MSNAEKLAEHARHQRDHFADEALKAVSSTEARTSASQDPEILFAESDKWNSRYERYKAQNDGRRERISIVREPLTYEDHKRVSYFADRVMASHRNDPGAEERLQRHAREMEVLSAEERSNPSRTDGHGGYFSPPRWLIEQAATAPRPNRILSRLVESLPLPPGASEISLPALTSGTKVEPDADDAANESQDIVDARVSSPVVSIAGQEDVSIQLLEQSPQGAHLDKFLFKDMEEAFNANLEEQVIIGSTSPEGGPFYEFTGILNLTGINKVSYTAAAEAKKMIPYMGRAIAQIGKLRKMPPEAWMMTSSRWGWLCTQEDNQERPLVLASSSDTQSFPVGSLFGLPVYLNDALPENRNGNQDVIICCRPKDFLLLESEPKFAVMEDVLSGTLQVRLVVNRYVAFLGGKYPTGISALEGTGMAVQSGY